MTAPADAPATEARQAAAEDDAPSIEPGPLVHLGLRRGWWVVVCVLLLVAVDLIPIVGPYLSLAVLMWMVSGLARAEPRPAASPRVRRAPWPGRASRSDRGTALTSS